MNAFMLRARADLRSSWRAWLALVLIAGTSAGVVIAAVAGGRRADTAMRRFETAEHAIDVFVFDRPSAAELPHVRTAVPTVIFSTANNDAAAVGDVTGRLGTSINRFRILAGRAASPDRTNEIVASAAYTRRYGLHVGSTVHLPLVDRANRHRSFAFTVVGIEVSPIDITPNLGIAPPVYLSPAFVRRYQSSIASDQALAIRLDTRANVPAFERALERGSEPAFLIRQTDHSAAVQRSLHLQAVALWIVALCFGLVALLVAAQLFARQAFLESVDYPTMRALGSTRAELFASSTARALLAGATTTIVAVGVAVLLSPIAPLGHARDAEPNPGFALDAKVLATGAAVTFLVTVVLSAVPAWFAVRYRDPTGTDRLRPSLATRAVDAFRLGPSVGVGMRMALERGRGRTAVPALASIVGVTIAIAALAGSTTFGASLDHLLATPRLYGWGWDASIDSDRAIPVRSMRADPDVAAFSIGESGIPLQVENKRLDALTYNRVVGDLSPVVTHGRAPVADDEILLGSRTMRATHAHIGDGVTVHVVSIARRRAFRVVGEGVLPANPASRFGEGAAMTLAGLETIAPKGSLGATEAIVQFAPTVAPEQAIARLQARLGDNYTVNSPQQPSDIVNFGGIQDLPVALAALLGVLGGVVLLHTLVTSTRRRRPDFAVLRALGFRRRDVRRTVTSQAATLMTIAVLVGLPLGAAGGRAYWRRFAEQLGTIPVPVTPVVVVLGVLPVALVAAGVLAMLPSRLACRAAPAETLRAE
jgi:ABC-type lipoprotein release transport system permease subunit